RQRQAGRGLSPVSIEPFGGRCALQRRVRPRAPGRAREGPHRVSFGSGIRPETQAYDRRDLQARPIRETGRRTAIGDSSSRIDERPGATMNRFLLLTALAAATL